MFTLEPEAKPYNVAVSRLNSIGHSNFVQIDASLLKLRKSIVPGVKNKLSTGILFKFPVGDRPIMFLNSG